MKDRWQLFLSTLLLQEIFKQDIFFSFPRDPLSPSSWSPLNIRLISILHTLSFLFPKLGSVACLSCWHLKLSLWLRACSPPPCLLHFEQVRRRGENKMTQTKFKNRCRTARLSGMRSIGNQIQGGNLMLRICCKYVFLGLFCRFTTSPLSTEFVLMHIETCSY